ncbi:hypothetical protein [Caballeronia hypogeia]|uniref:hypothetical protein n=1 Tax=Caballeronia hypogeia TaxID=1777140 RepID=UPI0018DF1AC2|nr:hypothetical protein [Caballeronia hypogeia]
MMNVRLGRALSSVTCTTIAVAAGVRISDHEANAFQPVQSVAGIDSAGKGYFVLMSM